MCVLAHVNMYICVHGYVYVCVSMSACLRVPDLCEYEQRSLFLCFTVQVGKRKVGTYLDLARELKKFYNLKITNTNGCWSLWNILKEPVKEIEQMESRGTTIPTGMIKQQNISLLATKNTFPACGMTASFSV